MRLAGLAYAVRTLRRSPAFTVAAALTLALGIGASTAIFSVTNAVLLRPLPYQNPGQLIAVTSEMTKRNVKDWPFSNADFFDLRTGTAGTFEDLEGVNTTPGTLSRSDGSFEEVHLANVTPNFLRMMGAQVAFGRNFTEADGQPQPPQSQAPTAPGLQAPPQLPTIAILSHEYFKRRYGGDRSIIGRPLTNTTAQAPQVVGVLASNFELLLPSSANIEPKPDIWIASRLAYDNAARNTVSLELIGRLKKGITLDRAQTKANAIAAELRRNFPIHNTSGFAIRLEPIRKHLVAAVEPALVALMGAVIFLLLIACANVANLMLVRMSSRERELAVRSSLGGSWWILVRQTLTESLLLSAIGTILGLGLAWLGIHELLVIAPADLPRLESIKIDPTVLAFTALTGLLAAALFGIAPALRAARPNLMHVLRGSTRTAGLAGGQLLRTVVVISEIALCFVLLVGSGLMFRSFLALQHIDPGYDSRNLLTFQLFRPRIALPPQRAAFVRDIQTRLHALPGVQSVTASTPFPLTGGFTPIRWGTAQALSDPTKFQAVDFQIVLPGYFDTMHTPLVAGRTFTEVDNSPDRNLVVIDQALAAKAFPFESAVGKRILVRFRTPEPEWVEVIGVVSHQCTVSLAEPGREQIFFADAFAGYGAVTFWAVRTSGNPAAYAEPIRKTLAKIGPRLVVTETLPMEARVEQAQAGTRFSLLLIGIFAVIAALLAAVGLYGVLSSAVRQRTAEIGVRMALGAPPRSIFSFFVGNGLRLSAVGIVIGIAAALALTRLMITMLVGIKPTDPLTFLVMSAIFLIIAAIASWLPARRASAVDPSTALRDS